MATPRCAVVLDVGSYRTRVGLSRDPAPSTFPSLVSRGDRDGFVVATEARTSERPRVRPLDIVVLNWDGLEAIYEHAFQVVGVEPRSHPLVINRLYLSGRKDNEKIAQIVFEKFAVPGLHLNYSPVLALYGQDEGALTGLVVDSGFHETQIYPIYGGHVLKRGMWRGFPVGGDHLTDCLRKKLQESSFDCDHDTASAIKERHLYVSTDLQKEEARDETVVIGDDQTVLLSNERFLIPEELYASSLGRGGLHEYIFNMVYRCDPSLRDSLWGNILLTGGNTMLPGFVPRLEKELKDLILKFTSSGNCEPKIVAPENRQNLVWQGGTKVANLPTFRDMCMTLQEYDEYGPGLVNTKFF